VFQQMRIMENLHWRECASAFQRVWWHHFLPRKHMCQAYAAKWLVFLFRLRWIIQDC
jgi:hypothetical protein